MRRHDLLCVGCNVMTSCVKKWNDMCHYEECCLLPWVVYVSQGFPMVLTMDRLHFLEEFLLLWRNVLMKHSDVELWTAEMSFQCNVRLINDIRRWIFCYWMNSFVKTFILLWREVLLLQRLLMEHFSSSVHHLLHFQPDRRTFIIVGRFTCFDKDFRIETAAKTLNRDWQHFESTLINCVTLWTVVVD